MSGKHSSPAGMSTANRSNGMSTEEAEQHEYNHKFLVRKSEKTGSVLNVRSMRGMGGGFFDYMMVICRLALSFKQSKTRSVTERARRRKGEKLRNERNKQHLADAGNIMKIKQKETAWWTTGHESGSKNRKMRMSKQWMTKRRPDDRNNEELVEREVERKDTCRGGVFDKNWKKLGNKKVNI